MQKGNENEKRVNLLESLIPAFHNDTELTMPSFWANLTYVS